MSHYKKFKYNLLIREHHLDSFGHVNNASYLEILEDARWEFLTQGGFSLQEIQAKQIGPVILDLNIKFLIELRLRQEITILSQVISMQNKTGLLQQDIFNQNQELACTASMNFGLFDMKQRKLIVPTEEWLRAIGTGI